MLRCSLAFSIGVVVVTSVTSCGRDKSSTGPTPNSSQMVEGLYYVEADTPDPLACTVDEDCTVGPISIASEKDGVHKSGCCSINVPHVQSGAWQTWIADHWQSERCKSIACGDAPYKPAPPPDCALDVRCESKRCSDACK